MNRKQFLNLSFFFVFVATSPAQTSSQASFQKEIFTDPHDLQSTLTLTSPTECELTTADKTLTGTYTRDNDQYKIILNDAGSQRVLTYTIATFLHGNTDNREFASPAALAGLKLLESDVKKKIDLNADYTKMSRTIVLDLFEYAVDHNNYPTGKSSTEVFQKLIDEKYVTDPSIFYFPMPGKVRASSTTLKPENVCWDVTSPVTNDSSDWIPLVFSTGYKITYEKGASAVPLAKPAGSSGPLFVIAYKSNSDEVKRPGDDGTIPNVIDTNFDPKGKTYHQLTPDGELPP